MIDATNLQVSANAVITNLTSQLSSALYRIAVLEAQLEEVLKAQYGNDTEDSVQD